MITRRVLPGGFAVIVAMSACPAPDIESDPLADFPRYEEQRQILCARGRENAVTAAICRDDPPTITSIVDLQAAVGLSFLEPGPPSFSLTANSSSLVARSVSAINPRAVIVEVPREREDESFMSLAFVRGEPFVEMAVRPPSGDLALYLLRYEQECDADDSTCTFEDRLTPATESGWTRWSLYDDVDLKNTILDCLHCHQPEGPGTPVHFRMQEFQNPWTHWMAGFGDGELALFQDYGRAHGVDEPYAGIPGDRLLLSNPIRVENFFKDSGSVEPNPFPSQIIEDEVVASSPGQPVDNSIPGRSPTWEGLYERAVRGEVIPPPYHDVKITDPTKLEEMTAAYVAWRNGALRGPLPDIRDVIREDAYADLSFRPKPGLNGRQILVHMCAQCHNSKLDQSLSRAAFDVMRLDEMSREEKDRAIDRLQRPAEDRLRMPPHLFRDLSVEEIDACIEELRR